MGCNCGGSTARARETEPRQFKPTLHERAPQKLTPRRAGGPGEPGFYSRPPQRKPPTG